MAAEGLYLPANFTSPIAPVCASNDNVDLNFLTGAISPPRICAALTVEFRKFLGGARGKKWEEKGGGGKKTTKRVTVKCCKALS